LFSRRYRYGLLVLNYPLGGKGCSMVRVSFAVVVVAVLAVVAGCTMCCHPYDYCGPVFEGQGRHATGCSQGVRAASVFAGTGSTVSTDDAVTTDTDAVVAKPRPTKAAHKVSRPAAISQPTPKVVQSKNLEGNFEGAEQVISVTDRVVDSPALVGQTASEPAVVQDTEPQSAKGWTAKRSTDASVLR
jgi:hypothetical protein